MIICYLGQFFLCIEYRLQQQLIRLIQTDWMDFSCQYKFSDVFNS